MTKYHPAVSKVQMQLPNPSSCQLDAWDRRWGRAGQQDGQEYQRKDMINPLGEIQPRFQGSRESSPRCAGRVAGALGRRRRRPT